MLLITSIGFHDRFYSYQEGSITFWDLTAIDSQKQKAEGTLTHRRKGSISKHSLVPYSMLFADLLLLLIAHLSWAYVLGLLQTVLILFRGNRNYQKKAGFSECKRVPRDKTLKFTIWMTIFIYSLIRLALEVGADFTPF